MPGEVEKLGGITREWHLLLMVEVERAKWWKARVVCDPVALYILVSSQT